MAQGPCFLKGPEPDFCRRAQSPETQAQPIPNCILFGEQCDLTSLLSPFFPDLSEFATNYSTKTAVCTTRCQIESTTGREV